MRWTHRRILDTLLRGVSTRNYKDVIPQMAETVGVSKSAVSRHMIEASESELEALFSRRFDDVKLLIIYIDGVIFGEHTMIGAVGVDTEGRKYVLGIREGATENSTAVTELLQDIVARGVDARQKRLFIIDGSKALRAAINAVFGGGQPPLATFNYARDILFNPRKESSGYTNSLSRVCATNQ